MKLTNKILISVIVLILAMGGLLAVYLPVRDVEIRQTRQGAYVGEVTRDVLVGQTFKTERENLASVAVLFSPFSGRSGSGPIYFHLRESIYSKEDVRVAKVYQSELSEEGFHRFDFEPIANSKGRNYFFFIVAPETEPGKAVTIGSESRNPYFYGSAYLVRGHGANMTESDILREAIQDDMDLAFKTYHRVPLRSAIISNITKGIGLFIDTWEDNLSIYVAGARAGGPAVVLLLSLLLLRKTNYDKMISRQGEGRLTRRFLLLLLFLGIALRLMYSFEMPFTSDEGNYLYDARSLREGYLAGGDGYVKSPLLIGWLALWQQWLGDSVLIGRISSVAAGSLTMFPIYILAKYLWDRRVGLIAASLWALSGATILYGIYVHTQPLAIFLALCGMALFFTAIRKEVSQTSALLRVLAAGAILALAVLTRKSAIVLLLLPLLLILIEVKSWRRILHTVVLAVGFGLIIAIFLGGVDGVYGDQGVWEAMGINSLEDRLLVKGSPIMEESGYGYVFTVFLRQSFLLFLLFLLGLGIVMEKLCRSVTKALLAKMSWKATFVTDHVWPKLLWSMPILIMLYAWSLWLRLEEYEFILYGAYGLWVSLAVALIAFTIWPRPSEEKIYQSGQSKTIVPYSTQPNSVKPYPGKLPSTETMAVRPILTAALFVPVWLFGLGVFYINWIKFIPDYIAEFLPAAVLLASFGGAYVFDRLRRSPWLANKFKGVKILRPLIFVPTVIVLFWAMFTSNYATLFLYNTGNLQHEAVSEAAVWARHNIPPDEHIFTGLPLLPYISGHRTVFDIAHPRWYAYEFTRYNTSRLNTFLPDVETMLQGFDDANWVLVEEQTKFSFVDAYPEIKNGLESDFVEVKKISNGDNPLVFYRRR